ncbi:5-(carboxyamino)imidazole ribonucleotide synthase [Caloramator fervidus]|uniref:N5-carboxyaminoimidazole ribonucleotide synthase n=1 Tax=Caloramator fervidus TaxID=29344 RepID=A0A1H5RSB9_9CLOT|nr:5-(carboxyamino)imidazole ribonucleotide synthase [Caloramator fervidus]SEF41024.1 5-(carboxyamino)imidazole ribonucleotide synthase [Caloramator fervidus]
MDTLLPPSRIGIIGGGQLGRMFAFEAKRMGYIVYGLDPKENSPLGQICDGQYVASFDDFQAYLKIARDTDVITYEFEHISVHNLEKLETLGYKVIPSSKILRIIQNKYFQKKFLKDNFLPIPKFFKIDCFEDLKKASLALGYPFVLKYCHGGYDGKGNIKIEKYEDLLKYENFDFKSKEVFAEEFIDFKKEVSIIVCKNKRGDFRSYPLFENFHEDGILKYTFAPASVSLKVKENAKDIGRRVLDALDDFGIFCIEMFLDKDDNLLINEVAPRPHNSGHLTIEACVTSQFENHLRSITNLPLGSTDLLSPACMINILGEEKIEGKYTIKNLEEILKLGGVYVHLYGKDKVDKRKKIGHITIVDKDLESLKEKMDFVIKNIKIGDFYEKSCNHNGEYIGL